MHNDSINATEEVCTESGNVPLGEPKEPHWEDEFSRVQGNRNKSFLVSQKFQRQYANSNMPYDLN